MVKMAYCFGLEAVDHLSSMGYPKLADTLIKLPHDGSVGNQLAWPPALQEDQAITVATAKANYSFPCSDVGAVICGWLWF